MLQAASVLEMEHMDLSSSCVCVFGHGHAHIILTEFTQCFLSVNIWCGSAVLLQLTPSFSHFSCIGSFSSDLFGV